MKKTITGMLLAALLLTLAGCGSGRTQPPTPTARPQVTAAAPAEPQSPAEPESARRDGERFETVIHLEGMEETVPYEHIVNQSLGFEMDYDYESFARQSTPEHERFIPVWDDPENPEIYLDVTCRPESADTVAGLIGEELSREYDVLREDARLDRAGACIRMETGAINGTGQIADRMETVYVIPAADGCRVARAHYTIESADGFGRRYTHMIHTIAVTDRAGELYLSEELALAAIRNYCRAVNPDLEGIEKDGVYTVEWTVESADEQQIVVLFRSYTGAQVRYHIDRITGAVWVSEFVPGVTARETRTEETLNAWDYAP